MWRAPRAITGGVFSRRLRATTGACQRLSMVPRSAQCRLRDGIPLQHDGNFCRIMSSLSKSNEAYTVKMCQSRRTVDGFQIMKIWKDNGFFMKIGRKSTIQFEIYAQNYNVKMG